MLNSGQVLKNAGVYSTFRTTSASGEVWRVGKDQH